MKPGLSQNIGMRQELRINPRLYQAMDLLYMPLLDLQQHLKQELLLNPFLELIEPDEDDDEAQDEAAENDEGAVAVEAPEEVPRESTTPDSGETSDWDDLLLGDDDGAPREERDDREYLEPVSVAARGLGDYLDEQINLLELTPRLHMLAEEFVGDINDDGYLACPLAELLQAINDRIRDAAIRAGRDADEVPYFTMAEAEAMLTIIQALDPAGVGARDLRECLMLQLLDQGRGESLAARLVREGFDDLVAHRWSELSKKLGISDGKVIQAAADEVSRLDPKPGRRFSGARDDYVTPDMVIEKIDGAYRVFLNDGNLPRLRISKAYQDIARDKKKYDTESRDFIATKLNAAQWMVQAIEQRRQTMLKVMNYIVDRQRDYFEKGVQGLKPLTLREVAEVIGMHESTVSRVTNEKYAQTPRGVLPLKFFFSSGLSTTDGDDVSARGIKDQIAKLVTGEDNRKPLTDQQIVEILKKTGVVIARRTVAKYRDQLGVLPARMRKRV